MSMTWQSERENPSFFEVLVFVFVNLAANLWSWMETRTGKLMAAFILTAAACYFWYALVAWLVR